MTKHGRRVESLFKEMELTSGTLCEQRGLLNTNGAAHQSLLCLRACITCVICKSVFRTQHGSGVEDYGQRERARARAREGERALRRSVRPTNYQHTAAAHRPKCQATAATKSNKAEDPSRLKQAYMTAEVFIARRSQSLGDTVFVLQ